MLTRIYLVGYMGSGKSSVASALAKHLRFTSYDIDKAIEEKAGKSIAKIFGENGQEYFREMERDILLGTASMENVVIATGGGTPCFFDNMDWMNSNGLTVYLEANPGLLFHRLAKSKKERPLIDHFNDTELMEQISGHLETRIPVYRKAKITMNAASLDVNALSGKIKENTIS
jgi:shikimate kinase